jgi:acetylornithine deacetylase/succinyl-diaminopimelate desuccinylase-like protein
MKVAKHQKLERQASTGVGIGASALVLFLWIAFTAPGRAQDRQAWEDRTVDLLRQYLQIDTTVPPGNEIAAARFYKAVLEAEGIPVEIDEFSPGRANLLATLKGNGKRRPLILANHMDVVPADPARWSFPPFSAAVKDGLIYGRGAQDMKTEGILQLAAVIRAKRQGLLLDRDVLFLATADEEVGFAGALRALSPQGWVDRLRTAEYLITEGGDNTADESGRPLVFGIATAEKGPYWLKLRTTGTPGHASRPMKASAVNRMIRALDRIRQYRTPIRLLPTVERFFAAQSSLVGEPRASWYRNIRKALRNPSVAAELSEDRSVSALLRNTISITVVRAGYKTNVIPGTAEAELDVRLLPGEDPTAFVSTLRRVINDPTVEVISPGDFRKPNESSAETELFRVITEVLGRNFPGVPVTTRMLAGATESVLFRPLGITCYGFSPLVTTTREAESGHGDDERIREATVRQSVGIFYDIVSAIAAGRPGQASRPAR